MFTEALVPEARMVQEHSAQDDEAPYSCAMTSDEAVVFTQFGLWETRYGSLDGMVFPSPGYHVSADRAAEGAQITLWFAAGGSSCEPSCP